MNDYETIEINNNLFYRFAVKFVIPYFKESKNRE